MRFNWLAMLFVLCPVATAARDTAILPPVPAPTKPLPNAPTMDVEGMPLIGFGYVCAASAGEDEFALSGTIDIGPDGEVGIIKAESAQLAANQAQVLAERERSKERWLFVGTLRWHLYWLNFGHESSSHGPYLQLSDAKLQFELTPERPMRDMGMTMSFTRNGDSALVVDGYAMRGKGYFYFGAEEFLNFDGSRWLVNKWPFQGNHIDIDKRFGFGSIKPDRIRTALANVADLNREFGRMLGDYKNLCKPVPYYESNDIII